MKLWDFFHPPERREIAKWANKSRLTPRERGQLNQKLDMLERLGFEVAHELDFLDGPVLHQKHIYKLVVHAGRMLRPMLCRGPVDNTSEMTLLCGAFEKDGGYEPTGAPAQAEQNRFQIKQSGHGWRIPHERF
jgi:hypothetical protein